MCGKCLIQLLFDLLLAENQLRRLESQFKAEGAYSLQKKAKELLHAYHWPGNVRELERLLIQGYIAARSRGDHAIKAEDLQVHMLRQSRGFDTEATLELQVARFRVAAAEYALAKNPGNKAAAGHGYRPVSPGGDGTPPDRPGPRAARA